jgi:hypothetical protein
MSATFSKDRTLARAHELARSGQFSDWLAIEHQLKVEGFARARVFLDARFLRQELDDLCRQSRVDDQSP